MAASQNEYRRESQALTTRKRILVFSMRPVCWCPFVKIEIICNTIRLERYLWPLLHAYWYVKKLLSNSPKWIKETSIWHSARFRKCHYRSSRFTSKTSHATHIRCRQTTDVFFYFYSVAPCLLAFPLVRVCVRQCCNRSASMRYTPHCVMCILRLLSTPNADTEDAREWEKKYKAFVCATRCRRETLSFV